MTSKEVDGNITSSSDGKEAGPLPVAVPVAIAVAIPDSDEEAQAVAEVARPFFITYLIGFCFQIIDMLLLLVGLQLPITYSLPF